VPVDASDGGAVIPFRALAGAAGTAGALAGDIPSLARWGHELFSGRVIQPRSLREMARFHLGAFWEAYGLGLARDSLDGRTMWGHSGDGLGSHTGSGTCRVSGCPSPSHGTTTCSTARGRSSRSSCARRWDHSTASASPTHSERSTRTRSWIFRARSLSLAVARRWNAR
jgi:hypothetical protein